MNIITIAVITHDDHSLYIERIDEDWLKEKYEGEIQNYIDDMYYNTDELTWDYINAAEFASVKCTKSDGVPRVINFRKI